MSEAVVGDTTDTEGEPLNSWRKTYTHARHLAEQGEDDLAGEAYRENNSIEAEMVVALPSLAAARACLFAAVSLMRDEYEGEVEPSYADLLRAAARHLGLTDIPEPREAA